MGSGAHISAHSILKIEGNVWWEGELPNLSSSTFFSPHLDVPSRGTILCVHDTSGTHVDLRKTRAGPRIASEGEEVQPLPGPGIW